MRLVALKDLSDKLPAGAEFDWRDDHAVTLIAAGLARAADAIAGEVPESASEPRGRRSYRRRDMQAEDTSPHG